MRWETPRLVKDLRCTHRGLHTLTYRAVKPPRPWGTWKVICSVLNTQPNASIMHVCGFEDGFVCTRPKKIETCISYRYICVWQSKENASPVGNYLSPWGKTRCQWKNMFFPLLSFFPQGKMLRRFVCFPNLFSGNQKIAAAFRLFSHPCAFIFVYIYYIIQCIF